MAVPIDKVPNCNAMSVTMRSFAVPIAAVFGRSTHQPFLVDQFTGLLLMVALFPVTVNVCRTIVLLARTSPRLVFVNGSFTA
ncbi:hypothetical protein D3C86_1983480 [compost metagenome]